MVDGEGVEVRDAEEVGWWEVGVTKGSFQKHLKTGVGNNESCS